MEPISSHAPVTPPRGFTLVEMLVVLVIIAVVTTIALVGQGTFNRTILLTDTAYKVALSIREMQSYGLSSRKFNSVQNPGYGAHFTASDLESYTLFADILRTAGVPTNCPAGDPPAYDAKPGNCLYDSGDGVVQTYTFGRGYSILFFCGKSGSDEYCSNGSGGLQITDLDIAFLRSDTDTVINGKRASSGWTPLSSAEIRIGSPTEEFRSICVSSVGQVSVMAEDCP